MKNQELAEIFEKIGDILELKEENRFKILAYRRVAQALRNLTTDVETIYKEGRLKEIPGVGEAIAKKIEEYLKTGKMTKYEELRKETI